MPLSNWLRETPMRWEVILYLVITATVGGLSAVAYVHASVEQQVDDTLGTQIDRLERVISEFEARPVTQHNNQEVNLPPAALTAEELRDRRLRDIHEARGTLGAVE